jgi:tripartite-type tricarboxylate transporter receptor subunit TctC
MIFDTAPAIYPHIKSGLARGLAVTTKNRLAMAPDLPTLSEAGLAGYESSSWGGLLAPAGTPPEIVTQLNSAIVRILTSPDVVSKMSGMGIEIVTSSPRQWEAFMQAELGKAAAFARAVGISPE